MANAAVEQLKSLGIRHGEKAAVGLTATLFVVLTAMAIIRPTMEMKPEELAGVANNASANLSKQQPIQDVLAKLEKDLIVEPNLTKVVDNQLKNSLKPDSYKARLEWVTPEPGAGLIRDQPELIAPIELAAFPGRGGIYMYALDDKGERVVDSGQDPKKRKGGRKGASKEEKPEDKKRREAAEEKKQALFAGKPGEEAKEKGKEEAAPEPAANVQYKEETKGKRWVVITGLLDNEQLKKNYLMALKNPAIAYPNYHRLDIQRRQMLEDGKWSEWADIDRDKCYDVLDNLPELETEYVPPAQRPEALVDPLPFLHAGYWTGVHVAKLVPKEILEKPKTKTGGDGGMMGAGGPGGMMGAGGPGNMGSRSNNSGSAMAGAGGESRSSGPTSGSRPGGGMMGSGGAGGGGEEANFTKIDEKLIMVRSLDFTVDPDNSYQFRVRIVVVNPNKDHSDVNPGVDIESKYLLGPWSEATAPATLPADVASYALAPEPAARRDDLVAFQVIKWDQGTGQTLVKNDGAGPGELIGEYGSIPMPSSVGGGPKPATLDFNSRSIVLDTYGGTQRLPDIGIDRNPFIVPALALVVEFDGAVVVRDQGADQTDEVREDMDSNYKQALKDSGEKRKKGSGSRMPGGNSGMGGRPGGSQMGGGRRGGGGSRGR
jgi:hypothetical protein